MAVEITRATRDLTAQCMGCHDLFEITIIDRRGELSVAPSSQIHAEYVPDLVIRHRCGAVVRVIWPGMQGPIFKPWSTYDPLAAYA